MKTLKKSDLAPDLLYPKKAHQTEKTTKNVKV